MAQTSFVSSALAGAAVAGALFLTAAPSEAAGLSIQRFNTLRGNSIVTPTTTPTVSTNRFASRVMYPNNPMMFWRVRWQRPPFIPMSPFARFF